MTEAQALEKEKELISLHNTTDAKYGYNGVCSAYKHYSKTSKKANVECASCQEYKKALSVYSVCQESSQQSNKVWRQMYENAQERNTGYSKTIQALCETIEALKNQLDEERKIKKKPSLLKRIFI